jgi:RNA polymerase sigma-70 factor (ECF subfamily)
MGGGEHDPDRPLVTAAIGGDRAAFGELLRRHYDRIHGLAWRMTGSRADADDIAQDVCCALVEKIGGFRGEAKFSTWLCGIVFNCCRDHHRRRRSFQGFAQKLAVIAGLTPGPDGRDLHDRVWIDSAIGRLKPAYRDTVVLVAGEQLTHAEAAEILGVTESTVSWRMHEVRRMLSAGDSDEP